MAANLEIAISCVRGSPECASRLPWERVFRNSSLSAEAGYRNLQSKMLKRERGMRLNILPYKICFEGCSMATNLTVIRHPALGILLLKGSSIHALSTRKKSSNQYGMASTLSELPLAWQLVRKAGACLIQAVGFVLKKTKTTTTNHFCLDKFFSFPLVPRKAGVHIFSACGRECAEAQVSIWSIKLKVYHMKSH